MQCDRGLSLWWLLSWPRFWLAKGSRLVAETRSRFSSLLIGEPACCLEARLIGGIAEICQIGLLGPVELALALALLQLGSSDTIGKAGRDTSRLGGV